MPLRVFATIHLICWGFSLFYQFVILLFDHFIKFFIQQISLFCFISCANFCWAIKKKHLDPWLFHFAILANIRTSGEKKKHLHKSPGGHVCACACLECGRGMRGVGHGVSRSYAQLTWDAVYDRRRRRAKGRVGPGAAVAPEQQTQQTICGTRGTGWKGAVLGHHSRRRSIFGRPSWARVVNKNPDRQWGKQTPQSRGSFPNKKKPQSRGTLPSWHRLRGTFPEKKVCGTFPKKKTSIAWHFAILAKAPQRWSDIL